MQRRRDNVIYFLFCVPLRLFFLHLACHLITILNNVILGFYSYWLSYGEFKYHKTSTISSFFIILVVIFKEKLTPC